MFKIKWADNDIIPNLSPNHELTIINSYFGVYIENDKSEIIAYLTIRTLDINPLTEKPINKKYELLNLDVLSVDRKYQGLGLGTRLTKEVLNFCLPDDVIYIYPMSKISRHMLDKINDNRIVRNLKMSIDKSEGVV